MFVETLFCVVFFLTPLMAMVVMVIYAALKAGRNQLREETEPEIETAVETVAEDIKGKEKPIPVFQNPAIAAYQLIESGRNRVGHKKNRFKKGGHMRAGP